MYPIEFVYITVGSQEEAKQIATHLLQKKLIVCANFWPISSLYWWQDSINHDQEYVLIVKTLKEHIESIEKEVKLIHSYSIPCILVFSIAANDEFGNFVKNNLVP